MLCLCLALASAEGCKGSVKERLTRAGREREKGRGALQGTRWALDGCVRASHGQGQAAAEVVAD